MPLPTHGVTVADTVKTETISAPSKFVAVLNLDTSTELFVSVGSDTRTPPTPDDRGGTVAGFSVPAGSRRIIENPSGNDATNTVVKLISESSAVVYEIEIST